MFTLPGAADLKSLHRKRQVVPGISNRSASSRRAPGAAFRQRENQRSLSPEAKLK
jgi:hypothetical protein